MLSRYEFRISDYDHTASDGWRDLFNHPGTRIGIHRAIEITVHLNERQFRTQFLPGSGSRVMAINQDVNFNLVINILQVLKRLHPGLKIKLRAAGDGNDQLD